MNPTGTGSGTVTKISGVQPTVTFTSLEQLHVVGQATDSDSFHYTGTAGNDTHEFTPGATPDAGDVTGFSSPGFPFVPTTFHGINRFVFLGSGEGQGVAGGTDTLIVNGTDADDIFRVVNEFIFGSATLNLTAGSVARPSILFNGDRGVTTLTMHGLGGNDRFDLDFNPPGLPRAGPWSFGPRAATATTR